MTALRFDQVQVGDVLPGVVAGPITRHTLGLYAGASGDYNPVHIDSDFARQAGLPDVFAHGMLSAAYLARVLTNWVSQAAVRELQLRFVALTHVGDAVHCQARVTGKLQRNGERCAQLELTARSQTGEVRITGTAVVALE